MGLNKIRGDEVEVEENKGESNKYVIIPTWRRNTTINNYKLVYQTQRATQQRYCWRFTTTEEQHDELGFCCILHQPNKSAKIY